MITADQIAVSIKDPATGAWTVVTSSVAEWSITHSGSWCYEIRLSLSGDPTPAMYDPREGWNTPRLRVSVAGTVHEAYLEERSKSLSVAGAAFELWGRSKQAGLAEPFSPPLRDDAANMAVCGENWPELCTDEALCEAAGGTWGGSSCSFASSPDPVTAHPWMTGCLATEALAAVLEYAPDGLVVNWLVPDFQIPAGALSVENQRPIDVILRLAEAAGAEVIANIDGTLDVVPYVVDGAAVTPVSSWTDAAHIVEWSSRIERNPGDSLVIVRGAEDSSATEEPPPAFLSAELLDEPEWIDSTIHYRATVRLWRYHYAPPAVQHYAPGLEHIAVDASGSAVTTESVSLKWGSGNTSRPDLDGITEVTGDKAIPYDVVSKTYTTAYTDYAIRMAAVGDYRIVFWYSDGSAEADITVTVTAEDDPQGGDPSGAVGAAALAMVPITTPPVEPYPADGDADMMDFRLYWWHPSASPTWLVASDDAGFGYTWLMSGTESITETLKLQWGRASYTYTDANGVKEYFDEAYKDVPFATASVTYAAMWREIRCWSTNEGSPTVMVYFSDKTATVTASFQVQAPPDPEPDPLPREITIVSVNYYSDAAVPGDEVYIDGNYRGTTNADGQWTGTVLQGSHSMKLVKAGFQNTDDDALENDSFTVE